MAKGIIYVMNTCVDGLVKIGKTGSDNFEQRMTFLENNGYRRISVLTREFAIEVEDYDEKEKLLQEIFSKSRVSNSELFAVDINLVKQLMASLDGKVVYPQDETKNEIFAQATEVVEVQRGIIPEGKYHLSTKIKNVPYHVEAVMTVENGKLFIEPGAKLAPVTRNITKGWLIVRNNAKVNGHVLEERIECSSPSMAAVIVCGASKNGWVTWKDSNGDFISKYKNSLNPIDSE